MPWYWHTKKDRKGAPLAPTSGSESELPKICLNCELEFAKPDASYCHNCGQKNKPSKVTIGQVGADFIDNVFNVDNRLWSTLRIMFIPGRLTREYISGHRKKYLNPMRLFVVMSIIHFLTIGYRFEDLILAANDGFSQEITSKRFSKPVVDSMMTYISSIREYEELSQANKVGLDSLDQKIRSEYDLRDSVELDFLVGLGFFDEGFKVAYTDIDNATNDELYEKYEVEGWLKRTSFSQTIKIYKHGIGPFIDLIYGSVIWVILITIPLIALVMKIIYVRRKHYWVEHLIFLVHLHCLLFLVTSVGFGLMYCFDNDKSFALMAIPINAVLFWLSLKMYYRQGIIKTTIKWSMIGFAYIFTIPWILASSIFISFFLY